MEISIIGGGPAGLYFANAIKLAFPEATVDVYEVRNESITSYGLGYTLQQLNTTLLSHLDPDYQASLFNGKKPLIITEALFKTNHNQRVLGFPEGFSITRFDLMSYLRDRSTKRGVNIIEKKVCPDDLIALRKNSDLLVGADGVNSSVRSQYAPFLQPSTRPAKLKYSWYTNESEQIRTEACFYAFQAPEGVVMMTSYPLTKNKQVVFVEMTENCANSGRFKNKSPDQSATYLSEIFSQNGDLINLKSAQLPWYSFSMNSVKQLYHDNVCLLGDAANSFHFSAGQGVTSAFTMAYTLTQCLQKNPDRAVALQHFNRATALMYQKPSGVSLASIQWFERIDKLFQDTAPSEWLDLFIEKDKFKPYQPPALNRA